MASDNHPLTLMNIPLELRHQIFQYVALRDTQPKKLLRYWFEKKEVHEKTAQLAAQNPGGVAPVIVFEGDGYEHDEEYEEEDDGDEDDEEGAEDSDTEEDAEDDGEGVEDEPDSDEDQDQEDGEDFDDEVVSEDGDRAEDQNAEVDSTVAHITPALAAPSNAHAPVAPALTSSQQTTASTTQAPAVSSQSTDLTIAAQDSSLAVSGQPLVDTESDLSALMAAANNTATTAAQATVTTAPASTPDVVHGHDQGNAEGGNADTHMDGQNEPQQEPIDGGAEDEDTEEHGDLEDEGDGQDEGNGQDDADNINQESDDEDGDNTDDGESDEEMAEDHDDTAAGAAQPPPPAPIVTANSKWRHIPKFMQMTHCPPPVELLLACKQLNNEAKSWFYDVAVLRIEATGSFAHTSFFEEAFSQITEAAFSPMEDIHKAEVTFVWDTTWLRSDQAGCADAIFPALLRQRAAFVVGILVQAPNLCDVVIHWHDSAEDDESVYLMNDVLTSFLGLSATVKVEPHYIAADVKPYRNSVAGRRRVEFQNIVENGLDRLF